MAEFNQHFASVPSFKVTYATAAKRFPAICQRFKKKWTSNTARNDYLQAFSVSAWKQLSETEQQKHSRKNCIECLRQSENLHNAFPSARKSHTTPSITFTQSDLSNAKRFGRKVLRELNVVTNSHFSLPIQQVLVDTPKSKLAHPTTSATRQKEKRQLVNEVKKSIEEEMNGQAIVLQNRISWRKYDKMRATAGLTNTRKRVREQDENDIPPRKKKHGRHANNLIVDKEALLAEANEWNEDFVVTFHNKIFSNLFQDRIGQNMTAS